MAGEAGEQPYPDSQKAMQAGNFQPATLFNPNGDTDDHHQQ